MNSQGFRVVFNLPSGLVARSAWRHALQMNGHPLRATARTEPGLQAGWCLLFQLVIESGCWSVGLAVPLFIVVLSSGAWFRSFTFAFCVILLILHGEGLRGCGALFLAACGSKVLWFAVRHKPVLL